MQNLIGRTFGHYRAVDQIGAGGMGEVYRAHDERLDRDVAIKVLPEDVAHDPGRLVRFEREAKALAALNHPNIATVHGFEVFEIDRPGLAVVHVLVMELLDGESLREVISGGALSPGKAVEYARSIADGLAVAHEKGIVHRDLKPENVFLTRDGRIKILDFGLAKLKLPETELTTETPTATLNTAPGRLVGTVTYMAPEQVQGRPADPRSDIFALGVILYEMLTGKRPFGGSTTVETAAAILSQDPEPITAVAASVPPGLANVVSRCLEKRPADRFSSAHDLSLTLAAIDSEQTPQLGPSASALGRKWLHILAVAVAAVIGLLVILPPEALVDRLTGTNNLYPIRSIAVLPLENLTGDPEQEYFADGMTEALRTELAMIGGFEKVISRTSAMTFKGSNKRISDISDELGVEAILEGSVQRSDHRVRITVQLVHGATDRHLWAESYDRLLSDILTLQSDVAQAVAANVQIALTPQEQIRFAGKPSVDERAYEAYLQGHHILVNTWAEEDITTAIEMFEQAIEIDPAYAPAYVSLAAALQKLVYRYRAPKATMPRAKELVLQAVRLDDELAEAHARLGEIREAWDWDWSGAEVAYRRALELNPNSLEALWSYGDFLLTRHREEEAIDLIRQTVELDPLNPRAHRQLGRIYWATKRFEQSIAHLVKAIELFPNDYSLNFLISWSYLMAEMHEEAAAALQRAAALHRSPETDPFHLMILTWAFSYADRPEEAVNTLEQLLELESKVYVSPGLISLAYTGVGDADRAVEWLERAYEARDPQLASLNRIPGWDPIRADPRFQDIVRRMNFPES